jgi:hypothetical protein
LEKLFAHGGRLKHQIILTNTTAAAFCVHLANRLPLYIETVSRGGDCESEITKVIGNVSSTPSYHAGLDTDTQKLRSFSHYRFGLGDGISKYDNWTHCASATEAEMGMATTFYLGY